MPVCAHYGPQRLRRPPKVRIQPWGGGLGGWRYRHQAVTSGRGWSGALCDRRSVSRGAQVVYTTELVKWRRNHLHHNSHVIGTVGSPRTLLQPDKQRRVMTPI